VDGRGTPLAVVVTGANRHDVTQVEAVLDNVVVNRPDPTPVSTGIENLPFVGIEILPPGFVKPVFWVA
jgi:hypothetical protein